MFKFCKARSPNETLSDLEYFLRGNSDEPIEFLARTVDDWRKISYEDLEAAIAAGKLDELIDWQSRYAKVVNEKFSPLWLLAIQTAASKVTNGRITIDDSDFRVKDFLRTRGAELVTLLSDESRKAVAAIILHGQANMIPPKKIAQQIRPLIGLNARQAQANVNYRERIFNRLVEQGLPANAANSRADKAALKYASKQHRQRAEMIAHTELARAYNQGAHEGILAAQRAGLMGVCEMVWSTAGTNRVCGRCLALKDTVVGHTNESGVTLPPLHPRCRCTIIYREVGKPLTAPEVQTFARTIIKPDNPPKLNELLKVYATDEYITVDKSAKIPTYYELNSGKIVYNPNHPAWKFYDPTSAFTHEVTHLIDVENGIAVSLSNAIFAAVEKCRQLIFERKEHYEQLLDGKIGLNMSISDLIAAITDSQICGAFAHSADYWNTLGHREREIVANLATIYYTDDNEGRTFIETLPPLKILFEEVKRLYETSHNFTRRRIGIDAPRQKRTAGRIRSLST